MFVYKQKGNLREITGEALFNVFMLMQIFFSMQIIPRYSKTEFQDMKFLNFLKKYALKMLLKQGIMYVNSQQVCIFLCFHLS